MAKHFQWENLRTDSSEFCFIFFKKSESFIKDFFLNKSLSLKIS